MVTYTVPSWKFKEISEQIQVQIKDNITHSFFYLNSEFVCTSAQGDGKGQHWQYLFAHRIEDLRHYKGDLKPASYTEHYHAVMSNLRPRGDQGRLVQYKSRKVVLCEEYKFACMSQQAETEHSLF